MSNKTTPVRIGQIETGTTGNLVTGMWATTAVAVTCQKTGFQQIVEAPEEAMRVASIYANSVGGYVYRAKLPTAFAQACDHLPRS